MYTLNRDAFEKLHELKIDGQPSSMPQLYAGEYLVCRYRIRGDVLEEDIFTVCENLRDAQNLYNDHLQGHTDAPIWYAGRISDSYEP